MAEVQLALQRGPAGFEKLVVVKLVHDNLASEKTFVDMLLDEARMAALVKHPNVVDIYDLGQAEGRFFIAMEYLEGEPLLAVLRAGREGKRLDPLSTARLIADTAEGLDAAHELRSMAGDAIELVHHDISLGNIVILYNGQVKLVDFGVAKASQSAAGPAKKIQGKFSYMAPEKLRGGAGDRRSDLWSLGVVLWEALTLRRLFKGGNDTDTMKQVLEQAIPPPSAVNGDVIAAFDPILMKALARDPEKRYPTAKAIAQDLEDVLLKQGYGGRNDQIAHYMQTTFESHIEARKKLLQEVSSKGRASADVLEAAFAEPVEPVRASGDFSFAHKMPHGTPSSPHATPVRALKLPPPKVAVIPPKVATPATPASTPAGVPGESDATLLDAPLISEEMAAEIARRTEDQDEDSSADSAAKPAVDEPAVDEPAAEDTAARRAEYRRMYLGLGAIATVLVFVIVVSIVVGMRGGSGGADAALVAEHAPDAAAMVPESDAELTADAVEIDIEDAAPAAPADAATTNANAIDARVVVAPADAAAPVAVDAATHHVVVRRPSAGELTTAGLRHLATGSYAAAVISFRRAVVSTPRYAPAWRGLGVTYEKLGQKSAALRAYQRYLTYAPRAADAPAIRERVNRLRGSP